MAIASWLERHRDSLAPRMTQRLALMGMTGFFPWLVVTFDEPFAAPIAVGGGGDGGDTLARARRGGASTRIPIGRT